MAEAPATLNVCPQPMEIAAVWLPPGAQVSLHGRFLPSPDLEFGRYAEVGWNLVSGGCVLVTHGTWQALRNGRLKDARPVWAEAAAILRKAARDGSGPAAVYVVIEKRTAYGRERLMPVRVRQDAATAAGTQGSR